MRPRLSTLALAASVTAVFATPTLADDFSAGSKAQSWNLVGEEKALFSGKVVDLVCELAGDCVDDCGAGTRQLGIVRASDNALIPVLKNGQPAFNGAITDLLPYCEQEVDVDGLLVGEDPVNKVKTFQVQLIRRKGEEQWSKTELWTKVWNDAHPETANIKEPWFRKDPLVKERIEADGYLGVGKEADEKFIKEFF